MIDIHDDEGVYGIHDESLLQCTIHYVDAIVPINQSESVIEVDSFTHIDSPIHLDVPSIRDIIGYEVEREHTNPTFDDSEGSEYEEEEDIEKENVRNTLPYPNIDYTTVDLDNPDIEIDNLIDIDPETLKDLIKDSKKKSDAVSSMLLTQGSSNLMSLDNASAYAETVLRDGLGVTSKIDTSISIVLSSMLELKLVNYYMGTMDIPKEVSILFIEEFIKKRVAKLCENLNKEATGNKYSSVLRNLAGRVTNVDDNGTTPVGVVKSRSEHNKS